MIIISGWFYKSFFIIIDSPELAEPIEPIEPIPFLFFYIIF